MNENITILYVDDEPDLLTLGKIFLERTGGISVITAPEAKAALPLIADQVFDAIISDYQMPGMDGIEFLKHLRSIGNTTPFILYTGRGREEVVIEALNSGADFYLQKGGAPIAQFAELANKVRHAVSRKRAEKQVLDLQRRESEIINFLPDATFAIDAHHVVIAWNRAMEKLSGIPASDMIGKGEDAYSVPFYQTKRPILIDFVLDYDPAMFDKYPSLQADGKYLSAEMTAPWLHDGKNVYLWISACPLYDTSGAVVGAIESFRDITQTKETQALLEEKESRYRLTLDASNEGIWDWNVQTGTAIFSPRWFIMLGYEPDEFPQTVKTWEFLLHPDDLKRTQEKIQEHISGKKEDYTLEFRMRTKSGKYRWILARGRVIERDESESPARMVGTHTDITDFKHVEEKLRLDESRLEALLTLSGMTHKTIDDITRFALEEAVRLTESTVGYVAFVNDAQSVLTMHAWSQGAMKECQIVNKPISYNVDETGIWGEPIRQKKTVITNDYAAQNPLKKGIPAGHVSMTRHLGVPIFDGDHIVILVGVANKEDEYGVEDIRQLTLLMSGVWAIIQRKRGDEALLKSNEELSAAYEELSAAEEEIRSQYNLTNQTMEEILESENQQRILIKNLLDPIIIIGFDGTILFANPAAFRIFEMNPKDAAPSLPIERYLTPESFSRVCADLAEVQKNGEAVIAEYEIITSTGKTRSVEAAGHRIRWNGEDADLVSLRDITDRKGDKDALLQANRKLTVLSSITRHDILNQVTGLLGYLELLQDNIPDKPERDYIEKCLSFTKTIQSQIAFTKLVDDIRIKSLSWQYAEQMVQRVLLGYQTESISCQVDLEGLYLFADPILEKVIFTLIENSVRHGEHVSHIHFSYQITDNDCVFVCEDDGSGIPGDEKEKIFGQGYGKHTGLGLFLVREILAINGMTIEEKGIFGSGARFEIHVPAGKWRVKGIELPAET